jgi:hypothetical protein
MAGPTSKKAKEPPKRTNLKGNIKFLNPPLVAISLSNRVWGGPPERMPNLEKPSPTATSHLKVKIAYTRCNTIDTLSS